jgi:DNA-binding NarL/FixJ family response regulator
MARREPSVLFLNNDEAMLRRVSRLTQQEPRKFGTSTFSNASEPGPFIRGLITAELIVTDLIDPGPYNGIPGIRILLDEWPYARILVFSAELTPSFAQECLDAGATGCLSHQAVESDEELLKIFGRVLRGTKVLKL